MTALEVQGSTQFNYLKVTFDARKIVLSRPDELLVVGTEVCNLYDPDA